MQVRGAAPTPRACSLLYNCTAASYRCIRPSRSACLRRLDVKKECIEYLAEERARREAEGSLGPFVLLAGTSRNPSPRDRLKPVNPDSLSKSFAKMIRDEGMDPAITVYCLRHTYATMALRSGVDLRTVQRNMGHSDIRTTMDYLHYLDPEQHHMDKLPY